MDYIYPAVFHVNNDGSYTITYPDLPGCVSEGKSLGNALDMAQSALSQWLGYLAHKDMVIPGASPARDIHIEDGEFVNLVCAKAEDTRAVRRTVSIPKWMDDKATKSGLSLSRILQSALKEHLQV